MAKHVIERYGQNVLSDNLYECDELSDLDNINPVFGREVYVINIQKTFKANSLGEWKIKNG